MTWQGRIRGSGFGDMLVGIVHKLAKYVGRAVTGDRESADARRAIRELSREQRLRRRGSLRGEGQGGDPNLAIDAAITSDSGGTP